jgi:hypothetical protein
MPGRDFVALLSFVYCGLGRGLAQASWTEIFEAGQLDQDRR